MVDSLIQDVRYSVRQLRRSPGFALTAILTLAAGIAATCVVFSIVEAVLLRPLAYPDSDRLVSINVLRATPGRAAAITVDNDVSYPDFFDWRSQARSFASLSSYQTSGFTLTDRSGGPAQQVLGGVVSFDLFTTLGVSPALGRGFVRGEEQAGNRSVVIGSALWQSQFAGTKDVLGRHIRLSDEEYTVVGVMGREFQFPADKPDVLFWITPAHELEGANASANQRGWTQVQVIGRLRPGVSMASAGSELNAIQKRLSVQYPEEDKNQIGSQIVSLRSQIVGDEGKPLKVLFGAVSFLLLIACANVAGLLLARAYGRRAEIAVRASLGAGRARILRQVLIESICLACCGGALGLGMTSICLKLAPFYLPADLPRVHDISMNFSVAVFAVALSLFTGVAFGVVPAWHASRLDPALALRGSARGATASKGRRNLQSALVVVETAMSLILLVGAGLMIRSFDRLMHVNPGFDPDQLLTFRVAVPPKRYSNEQRTDFFNRLLPQLESLPGVKSATGAFPLPLTGGDIRLGFTIVGQKTAPGDEPSARLSLVQRDYLSTFHIPIVAGRDFNSGDHRADAAQVMMVNQAFARRFFPGEIAVGKQVQTDVGVTNSPVREIVGVVGDVKRANLTEESQPEYYVPIEQGPLAPPTLAIRVAGDPARYEAAVRALVARMDASLPVYRVSTYRQYLVRLSARQRFIATLLAGFASIALLLSGVGLYGLLSYMVSDRAREIGLRLALGAQRSAVQRQVLLRGLALAAIGVVAGGAIAALLTRFIAALLFGVGRFDLATFLGTAIVLLTVSCVASFVPSYRASRLDPMQVLRSEQ
jgi:predicted permease